MDRATRRRLTARADVIKAMAHPTRLFLVEELSRGEQCVCDLTAMVGADISTVSRHLAVLRQAGILSSERKGQQIFYRLETPCVLGFFDCIEGVLNPEAAAEARRSAPRCGC